MCTIGYCSRHFFSINLFNSPETLVRQVLLSYLYQAEEETEARTGWNPASKRQPTLVSWLLFLTGHLTTPHLHSSACLGLVLPTLPVLGDLSPDL